MGFGYRGIRKDKHKMADNEYIVPYEDNFSFEMYNAKGNQSTPPILHYHDALELNYVTAGGGINYIEDKVYHMKAGELYLINNLEHHIAVSDGTLQMKVVVFHPDLLWQNTADNINLLFPFYSSSSRFSNQVSLNQAGMEKIHEIFEELEEEWNNRENGYKFIIKAKLMELTGILYRHLNSQDTLQSTFSYQSSYEKIRPSIDYINKYYHTDLSLDVLAGRSCMSKAYFCTYFKKVTRMTLWEYVELIRINHAQLAIITSTESITDICYKCGFNSISTFNSVFKKITGMTPSQYRKNAASSK